MSQMGFTPSFSWVAWWILSLLSVWHTFPQTLQENGLTPWCSFIWVSRYSEEMNFSPHPGDWQTYCSDLDLSFLVSLASDNWMTGLFWAVVDCVVEACEGCVLCLSRVRQLVMSTAGRMLGRIYSSLGSITWLASCVITTVNTFLKDFTKCQMDFAVYYFWKTKTYFNKWSKVTLASNHMCTSSIGLCKFLIY